MTLVGHWPLHEDSGSTAADHSGNGNDGTINGATVGQSGILGTTAYSFDGTDDNVTVSNDSALNPTNLSVVAWVNPSSLSGSANEGVIDKTVGFFAGYVLRHDNNGDWLFGVGDGGNFVTASTSDFGSTTGQWYQLIATWEDSTDIKLFINGVRRARTTHSTSIADDSNSLYIGEKNGSENYTGKVSDIRIYDHVLSPASIKYLYNVTTGGSIYTGTKTHGSAVKPDLRADCTLNGESIDAFVIGSPRTGSQEIVHQSLSDGNNDYTLSWSNSHTDFAVQLLYDVSTVTNRPEAGRVALLA